jgi:hypothetical protein
MSNRLAAILASTGSVVIGAFVTLLSIYGKPAYMLCAFVATIPTTVMLVSVRNEPTT